MIRMVHANILVSGLAAKRVTICALQLRIAVVHASFQILPKGNGEMYLFLGNCPSRSISHIMILVSAQIHSVGDSLIGRNDGCAGDAKMEMPSIANPCGTAHSMERADQAFNGSYHWF